MKHLFIVNPAAGSHDRTADYTTKIDAAFANRAETDMRVWFRAE